MKKRKLIGLLACLTLIPCLTSCQLIYGKEDEFEMNIEEVDFKNYSQEYTVKDKKVNLYYKEDSHLPYVSIKEMLNTLDGYLESSKFSYSRLFGTYSVSISNLGMTGSLKADYDKNTLKITDFSVFDNTKETQATDYSHHLEDSDFTIGSKHGMVMDLDKYGFDVIHKYEDCLIPLFVFNLLFCSGNYYNVYFNGEILIGVDQFLNTTVDKETYLNLKTSKLNNSLCPKDLREDTLRSIYFLLDYYYGLKQYKGIEDFEEAIPEETKQKILSTDPKVFNEGYYDLFQKQLDELHTSIYIKSFYCDPNEGHGIFEEGHIGSFWERYYAFSDTLDAMIVERFGSEIPPVRYVDDTAIIYFESFDTAATEDLLDENGNEKEDAWKMDSYYFMKHVLNDIDEHGNIENIVLDLTTNGGGNIGAMLRVAGFLTDKDIGYANNNIQSDFRYVLYDKIDTDDDGDFNDNDAYSNYNWNILTSLNTFSAANYFTALCKTQGIATIIGEKTGGGMCSVLPVIIADGTSFRLSSPSQLRTYRVENGTTYLDPVEDGVEPDKVVEYTKFYDDEYIDSVVSSIV